jgi:uncharacterized membrane protein
MELALFGLTLISTLAAVMGWLWPRKREVYVYGAPQPPSPSVASRVRRRNRNLFRVVTTFAAVGGIVLSILWIAVHNIPA